MVKRDRIDGPHPALLGGDHRLEERLAHREEDLEAADVVEDAVGGAGARQVLAPDRAALDLLFFDHRAAGV
jgi:hypothetical protein